MFLNLSSAGRRGGEAPAALGMDISSSGEGRRYFTSLTGPAGPPAPDMDIAEAPKGEPRPLNLHGKATVSFFKNCAREIIKKPLNAILHTNGRGAPRENRARLGGK